MGSEMSLQVQSDLMAYKKVEFRVRAKALSLVFLMFVSSIAALEFAAYEASATPDQDGDGLTCGMEFLLQTQCQDWDSDNDGLPDGWEWKYGLNPNDGSSLTNNGASGDPDGDSFSNLQEYNYLMPLGWDSSSTANVLDNGVWWNGTVPVRNWNEEDAMQVNQPGCGDPGSDGNGSSVILCDEDPVGDICNDGIDNDKDGLTDMQDPDRDGDQVCGSDDDDGDGVADEDPDGWDTDGDGMPDGWEVSNGLNATNPNGDDGMMGDPDNDGLVNIQEYINPSWTTSVFQSGNPLIETATETVAPCNPLFGCLTQTASVDQDFDTNPFDNDSDNDGLEDGWEALTILTDPTAAVEPSPCCTRYGTMCNPMPVLPIPVVNTAARINQYVGVLRASETVHDCSSVTRAFRVAADGSGVSLPSIRSPMSSGCRLTINATGITPTTAITTADTPHASLHPQPCITV